MKIGIVGLAQSGKTTLFEILTRAHGSAAGAGRPEARVGVVRVPDRRLDRLAEMYHPKKTVYASVEYVDTSGSIIEIARAGAQMAALREMDALAHVVGAFGGDASAPEASLAGARAAIESVELELMLSDLAVIEKRVERLEKDLKKIRNPVLEKEFQALQVAKTTLEKQTPLREVPLGAGEEKTLRGFTFLSMKPMLYVLNLGEKDAARLGAAEEFQALAGFASRPRTEVTAVCGRIEAELAQLDEQDAAEFLSSYGLKESAIARLIRSSYHLLGLISFFTVGEDECRAWTIRSGRTALEAAGEIHSDLAKGFIRAEVVKYDDLVSSGGLPEARTRGVLKLEGKEYVVQDGEIVHIRHSG
ncbi:MAG: redox-regulated ATPase YchF [Acidobacteria bacterium]|nr:MAG: redox-regulated ATPase YchF [Acidobacteriota bacterium]